MERDGPKTVQELFDGTNPEAECAGDPKPIHHEWYVHRRVEGPIPKRYLWVVCRSCGATGQIEVTHHKHEWEGALACPHALPLPDWPRVGEIEPRDPDEWDERTEGRARPPQRK